MSRIKFLSLHKINDMKAKNYRSTYNDNREMIMKDIKNILSNLPEKSLDISNTDTDCILDNNGDDQETISAMGVSLDEGGTITVHGGYYAADFIDDIKNLWYEQLLDLYTSIEEAMNDDPQPFE